jgi:hypothetical protein
MLVRPFADEDQAAPSPATTMAPPTTGPDEEPIYSFDGYTIEFNERVVLIPPAPRPTTTVATPPVPGGVGNG